MKNIQLTTTFTNTPEEEINSLVKDLRLIPLVQSISEYKDKLPQEVVDNLSYLLEFVSELVSTSLPDISINPEVTLRTVSRDINLSRILRERGLFRLYRFITTTVNMNLFDGELFQESNEYTAAVPMYMAMENPMTNGRFTTQEEFIGWFCQEAHVSRSLVFMRIATINKILSLGFSLEEAFNIITKKPSVIREMLNMLGEWDGNELVSMEPDIALQIAEHSSGYMGMDELKRIIDENPNNVDEIMAQMIKPALADLVEQVAYHDRSQGALDFIKYDIFGEPEISYKWDAELDALIVEYTHKAIDENGREYIVSINKITLIPDTRALLPTAVRQDLLKRLPIKNKNSLDKV